LTIRGTRLRQIKEGLYVYSGRKIHVTYPCGLYMCVWHDMCLQLVHVDPYNLLIWSF